MKWRSWEKSNETHFEWVKKVMQSSDPVDIPIQECDEHGNVIREWLLKGAYVKSVKFCHEDDKDSDEIDTVIVSYEEKGD